MTIGPGDLLDWIREQLPRVAPSTEGTVVTMRTELADIDIDSLETLVLFGKAERRFGFTLPDDVFMRLETVGDVIDAILDVIRTGPRG